MAEKHPHPEHDAESQEQLITWVRPSFTDERDELHDQAERLGIDLHALINACEHGTLEPLDDVTWETIENTDSNGLHASHSREDIRAMIVRYGRPPERADDLFSGMTVGNPIPAPIVLFRTQQPPYLIAGNTRLCVARALRVRPTIFAVRMP
ncbi:MAG: hypothetical protein Q7S02_01780 [bacterium]|nr:hypothetical protein [bacterium]